jgi:hypothetical protein
MNAYQWDFGFISRGQANRQHDVFMFTIAKRIACRVVRIFKHMNIK